MGEMALCVDLGTYTCKAGFGGLESNSTSRWTPDVIIKPVDNNDDIIYEFEPSTSSNNDTTFLKSRSVNKERFSELFQKLVLETNIEPDESSILISTPMTSSMLEKHTIANILFEEFNVKSLYFGYAPMFAAFAKGKTSAIVLNSGHDCTSLTEIHDGLIDHKKTSFFSIAGKDITEAYGKCFLNETKDNNKLIHQFEVGTDKFWPNNNIYSIVKEKFAFVSKKLDHDRTKTKNGSNLQRYKLPDGSWITTSQPNYEAPQILFDRSNEEEEDNKMSSKFSDIKQVFGNKGWSENGNIVDMFYHHTCKVNKDLKNPILDVIFTGGNTMIKSFDKKFQLEFKHICEHFDRGVLRAEKYAAKHADTRFQANKYAAWAGCSMLAGYSPLIPLYVTKEQYNEVGDKIITARYK